MRRVRQKDTAPERALRKLLTARGLRYRVCPKDLPGRPDIANKSQRWAIFVHGCFWHGHRGCRLATLPKTNRAWWSAKLHANRARDARKVQALRDLGFAVVVVWQCELSDPDIASRVVAAIGRTAALPSRVEMVPSDEGFLRRKTAPPEPTGEIVRIVDLFAGSGGMTLGAIEACRSLGRGAEVVLSMELDRRIRDVYDANFATTITDERGDVRRRFHRALRAPLSPREAASAESIGEVDVLIGGPPCQGHSNLNNATRRADPKNALYARMVRAAEVLRPRAVVIENVPGVIHDQRRVVARARRELRRLDYAVVDGTVCVADIGIPQLRIRHVLLAVRQPGTVALPSVAEIVDMHRVQRARTLRWALTAMPSLDDGLMDAVAKLSKKNRARARTLQRTGEFDLENKHRPPCHSAPEKKKHKYKSMYGRLDWTKPAQTITTGFGSPGQGRYLHPDELRTITAREAARVQFFPDWFDFSAAKTREVVASCIGNAVPPKLAFVMVRAVLEIVGAAQSDDAVSVALGRSEFASAAE